MPCTFSHPAAVLPLKRLCPRYLDFSALVIGSLSPDFGYYFHQFPLATYAHTLRGSLAVCLPAGLVAWLLYVLLREPVCFLLPAPHREALLPLCENTGPITIKRLFTVACSMLLGAWTHNFWDAFTRPDGWFVSRIGWLQKPLLSMGSTALPAYYLLQQASTLAGAVILVHFYWVWLRRHTPRGKAEPSGEQWRYFLWAGIVVTSIAVSFPPALKVSRLFEGYMAFRVLLFRTGVYSVAVAVPLVLFASIAIHYSRRGKI